MPVKRAFGWFVRNVRETSGQEPVSIELERNREAAVELGAQNPPDVPLYTFRLGLRAGFSGEQQARVPVFKKVNPHSHPVLKEIFFCEVAGTMLEAANVHALREKAADVLETLAPAKSLPLAYFRVPAMDYSLPVYEDDGEIVCPVIAGQKLKAPDLASMRRHVFRYLLNAGYVTDEGQFELLVLRPSDLRLVPPAALVSCLADPDLWFATVEGRSPEGLVIGLLGEATELRPEERQRAGIQPAAAPPAATDIASLLRLIGGGLGESGRLADPYDLFATQVRPEIWRRTEQLSDDIGRRLTCWLEGEQPTELQVPLRRTAAGELLTAIQDDGISVFVAGDEAVLSQKLGKYLSGHGFLRWQDTVEVVSEEAHAELEPESERIVAGKEVEFPRFESGPHGLDRTEQGTEEKLFDNQRQHEEVRLQ